MDMPQQNITTYNTNVPTLRNLQCSLSPVKCEAPPRRRKAIKQPSSRGLCLKVTLGGQIDGISGANGFHESTRRTCPRTPAASQFGNKVSFRSRCTTMSWTPFQLVGWFRLMVVCTEERGLHSVRSAAPCASFTIRSSERFSCAH